MASVPELTSRTFSIDGTARDDQLGQFALGLGRAPKVVPATAASCTAATTAGWAWPRIIGPQEPM